MRRSQPFLLFILVGSMDMTATAALARALSTSTKKMVATERSFLCSDGIKIAAQQLKSSSPPFTHRILCLHGWLDNCQSFHQLAPSLVSAVDNTQLVALDFPGHGLSSHKSSDAAPTVTADFVFYVAEAIQQLQWTTFTLIGHSMGAAVSLMYAAAFPEQVEKLVLLEGAGPLTRPADQVAQHIRAAVERRQAGNSLLYPQYTCTKASRKEPRTYETIDAAVEMRCKTATLSPGNQTLSKQASLQMVQRATIPVKGGGDGVQFRHDARLQWPSLLYMTDEQVEALYKNIMFPVCLLLAENGWPLDDKHKKRIVELLQPSVLNTLPGSHHFHADPETADTVTEEVIAFLKQEETEE